MEKKSHKRQGGIATRRSPPSGLLAAMRKIIALPESEEIPQGLSAIEIKVYDWFNQRPTEFLEKYGQMEEKHRDREDKKTERAKERAAKQRTTAKIVVMVDQWLEQNGEKVCDVI